MQENHTLINALRTARNTYADHAIELRKLAKQPAAPNALITPDGARMMAEQFEQQVKDVDQLIEGMVE